MDKDKPDFVESVIFRALSGRFEGEYVAACASEPGCGYMGGVQPLLITRLFTHCCVMKISSDGTAVPLPWAADPALP